MLNAGKDLAAVLQAVEISESTLERWQAQYGGMKFGRRSEGVCTANHPVLHPCPCDVDPRLIVRSIAS